MGVSSFRVIKRYFFDGGSWAWGEVAVLRSRFCFAGTSLRLGFWWMGWALLRGAGLRNGVPLVWRPAL